jgi:hypothetical protein
MVTSLDLASNAKTAVQSSAFRLLLWEQAEA